MVDEIAFAMKSCFTGLYLDGFDFIQGVPWISSLLRNDFIKQTEKEITFRLQTDLLSLSVVIRVWVYPIMRLTGQMRCSHLTAFFKFSAKNITHCALSIFYFMC